MSPDDRPGDWHDGIDGPLADRLARRASGPGVIDRSLATAARQRLAFSTARLPLLDQHSTRWAMPDPDRSAVALTVYTGRAVSPESRPSASRAAYSRQPPPASGAAPIGPPVTATTPVAEAPGTVIHRQPSAAVAASVLMNAASPVPGSSPSAAQLLPTPSVASTERTLVVPTTTAAPSAPRSAVVPKHPGSADTVAVGRIVPESARGRASRSVPPPIVIQRRIAGQTSATHHAVEPSRIPQQVNGGSGNRPMGQAAAVPIVAERRGATASPTSLPSGTVVQRSARSDQSPAPAANRPPATPLHSPPRGAPGVPVQLPNPGGTAIQRDSDAPTTHRSDESSVADVHRAVGPSDPDDPEYEVDPEDLTDEIVRRVTKRLAVERERRGWFS